MMKTFYKSMNEWVHENKSSMAEHKMWTLDRLFCTETFSKKKLKSFLWRMVCNILRWDVNSAVATMRHYFLEERNDVSKWCKNLIHTETISHISQISWGVPSAHHGRKSKEMWHHPHSPSWEMLVVTWAVLTLLCSVPWAHWALSHHQMLTWDIMVVTAKVGSF